MPSSSGQQMKRVEIEVPPAAEQPQTSSSNEVAGCKMLEKCRTRALQRAEGVLGIGTGKGKNT